MTKRISNKITYISFILSLGVIFIHTDNREVYNLDSGFVYELETRIWQICTNVCVPMFFIMSAFLFYQNLNTDNLQRKLKSRIRSLVIPYLIWNAIYYIFFKCMYVIPFTQESVKYFVEPFTLNDFFRSILLGKYNLVSWFLRCLIVYTFITPIYIYIYI